MTGPPTLADPGELIVSCTDCHDHATVPVAALLPRYVHKKDRPKAV